MTTNIQGTSPSNEAEAPRPARRTSVASILANYDLAELAQEACFECMSPTVCTACGDEVDYLEADLDGTDWPCPSCGAGGRHIKSVARLAGLI